MAAMGCWQRSFTGKKRAWDKRSMCHLRHRLFRHPGPGTLLLYNLYGEIRTQVRTGLSLVRRMSQGKRQVGHDQPRHKHHLEAIHQGHRPARHGLGSPLCHRYGPVSQRFSHRSRCPGMGGTPNRPRRRSPHSMRPASPAVWCRRSTRHSSIPRSRRETWSWSWIIQGSAGSPYQVFR